MKPVPANADTIAWAARILREGGIVGFPTETVYGLGADATAPLACAKIFAAKGRPTFNPLIAHVLDLAAARKEALLPDGALRLAEAFWPGPLTLVATAAPFCSVCDLARAGLSSVALRAPSHPVARALLEAFGKPIAAPSANRSGRVSPVTAAHVAEEMGESVDAILDGGPSMAGLESSIVSFVNDQPTLLRPGAIAREALEEVLNQKLAAPPDTTRLLAPGMMTSHYAPHAQLRLDATSLKDGEAGIDFAGTLKRASDAGAIIFELSEKGDLAEAAANLFSTLRMLDSGGIANAAVAPIPSHGLGEAILDRLRRAAAPKPFLGAQ